MPAPENYETVGRIRIISTCVTESRMKSAVKTPARKNNNHWQAQGQPETVSRPSQARTIKMTQAQ